VVGLALVSALLSRFVFTNIIRFFYERPRPFVALPEINPLVSVDLNKYYDSFPSGHAAFFFAIAVVVYIYDKQLGVWFFAGTAIISIARVFAGVHWTTDIFGGAVVGIFSAWLVHKSWRIFQKRFNIQS